MSCLKHAAPLGTWPDWSGRSVQDCQSRSGISTIYNCEHN